MCTCKRRVRSSLPRCVDSLPAELARAKSRQAISRVCRPAPLSHTQNKQRINKIVYRCVVKNSDYQSWPADAISRATFSDRFLDTMTSNSNLLRDHNFDNVYTLSGVPIRYPVVNVESL
jgi:hypothetical protein